MNQQNTNVGLANAYQTRFQEAQNNFLALIREERLQKRIRKSREKSSRSVH